ncbi:MAG: hypothetical protein H6867_06985 [Rhodospirillales bacterium]|nr:hypothetical protein [Rhodospirillales bacterium]MCB9995294.1 hypothetical protein [Rhodospirillales bacterium]
MKNLSSTISASVLLAFSAASQADPVMEPGNKADQCVYGMLESYAQQPVTKKLTDYLGDNRKITGMFDIATRQCKEMTGQDPKLLTPGSKITIPAQGVNFIFE